MYRSFLAVRYFRTRLVNWLSVAGVMLGVAVMIVVWSVFTGFQVEVRKAIRGTLADIELAPYGDAPAFSEVARVLATVPEVVAAAPRLSSYAAHPFDRGSGKALGDQYHFMSAVGVDWAAEAGALARARKRGAKSPTGLPLLVLAADDEANPFYSREGERKFGKDGYQAAMFSLAFLQTFVGPRDAKAETFLGKNVEILTLREVRTAEGDVARSDEGEPEYKRNFLQVEVASVYDGKDHEADMRRVFFDRGGLWGLTRPSVKRAPGRPREPEGEPPYTEIAVTIMDHDRAARVRDAILDAFQRAGFPPFQALTWQDQRAPLLKAVSSERALLAIVIGFIGLLAGFTILATLTLTVVEKTRDIGVLRALGATPGGVMTVFLLSGVLIGVLGGTLGTGLGVVLTKSLEPIRAWLKSQFEWDIFPPDIYMFDRIPYVFDWGSILWIAGGCMLVSFLASLLPSLRASRMDPVVALRHE